MATEQRRQESAERAAVSAESTLTDERHRREAAERATALAESTLAKERRCRVLADCAAVMAESVLANEQRCQEEAACTAASVDVALAKEQRCHETATIAVALAEKLLAKERRCHETATQEKAFAEEANERRQAAALEKALANDANEQPRAAVQEKALADEANKQGRAAARDKALADEANERHRHESAKRATTLATKVLAKDKHNKDDDDVARRFEAYVAPLFARVDVVMAKIQAMDDGFGNWAAFGDEILAEEDDKASALTMPPLAPPTAVSLTPHRPTTYKYAVLATMGGSLRAKCLVVAPLSYPSTTFNNQPLTACRCSQPRRRVGHRHGPRAPNPQEHLLRGRQHRPRAPNQSTVNGWA